jgi:hypothetical protein
MEILDLDKVAEARWSRAAAAFTRPVKILQEPEVRGTPVDLTNKRAMVVQVTFPEA